MNKGYERAVFLDRDGTIIEEVGYLDRPERVEFFPFTIDAIHVLNRAGLAVVLVSNQSGIARGFFTASVVDAVHARMAEMLSGPAEQSGEIAWTQDGARVAFIVNGYQLRLFDARTGQSLGAMSLIEPDGSPSSRVARGVTFSNTGAAVTFDDCPRYSSGCKPAFVAIKR